MRFGGCRTDRGTTTQGKSSPSLLSFPRSLHLPALSLPFLWSLPPLSPGSAQNSPPSHRECGPRSLCSGSPNPPDALAFLTLTPWAPAPGLEATGLCVQPFSHPGVCLLTHSFTLSCPSVFCISCSGWCHVMRADAGLYLECNSIQSLCSFRF